MNSKFRIQPPVLDDGHHFERTEQGVFYEDATKGSADESGGLDYERASRRPLP